MGLRQNHERFRYTVQDLLKKGRIKRALDYISKYLDPESTDFQSYTSFLIVAYNRYNKVRLNRIMNIEEPQTLDQEDNRLIQDILSFLANIPMEDIKSNVKPFFDQSKQTKSRLLTSYLIISALVLGILSFAYLYFSRPDNADEKPQKQIPPITQNFNKASDTVYTADRSKIALIDQIEIVPRVYSLGRFRFSSEDSSKAFEIVKKYKTFKYVEDKVFEPTEWDIQKQWIDKEYDLEQNESLSRILRVIDKPELKNHIGEDLFKKVWLDTSFWYLLNKFEATNNTDGRPDIKIFPPEPQLTFVVFEIEGPSLSNAKVSLNTVDEILSESIRKEFPRKSIFNVPLNGNSITAGMILNNYSDVLTFQSANYLWEIDILRVSNPGYWRQPFKATYSDLVCFKYEAKPLEQEVWNE